MQSGDNTFKDYNRAAASEEKEEVRHKTRASDSMTDITHHANMIDDDRETASQHTIL